MNTPYFRAGAGAVIYQADGDILVFKRAGEDVWQFQQGGMDAGETPEQTLWRELEEETALTKTNFLTIHPFPTWTLYSYPTGTSLPAHYAEVLGQTHRWWFLELAADTTINLDAAADNEFEDYKWLSFADFMTLSTHSFKQGVYEELFEYFKNQIMPTLTKQH